jgi:ribonuclease R
MKNKIKSFFKKHPGREFKSKEIAKRLKVKTEKEYRILKANLHQLALEKFLSRNGKKYKLNFFPDTNRIAGHFQLNEGGFGFVVSKNPEIGDIFIAARNSSNAFHGDLVEVVLFAKQKGKNLEGQITKVIRRKKKQVVGLLRKSKSFYFISPDDSKMHRDIYIDKEDLHGAKPGDKVTVGKIIWEDRMLNPEGEVLEVLGKEGTLVAEVVSIAREFQIPTTFDKRVMKEVEKIEHGITDDIVSKRMDFRDKNVFTIDPKDAKDFDDALSIEKLENGNYKVGVHIADVSHYVKSDSELDKEALNRGNSTYLVGKAVPMLPEKISNNICSLVPLEDRLTYSESIVKEDLLMKRRRK